MRFELERIQSTFFSSSILTSGQGDFGAIFWNWTLMEVDGHGSDEVEVWWFVCTLCHRAYNSHTHLLVHRRRAHDAKGKANTLILSEIDDLTPVVKVSRCCSSVGSVPPPNRTIKEELNSAQNWEDDGDDNHGTEEDTARDGDDDPHDEDGNRDDKSVHFEVDVKEEDPGYQRQNQMGQLERRTRLGVKRYKEADTDTDDSDNESGNSSGSETDTDKPGPKPGRKYNCHICDEIFKYKKDVGIHCDTFHQSKEDRTCKICSKVYLTGKRLAAHTRDWHTRPLDHLCPTCGRAFSSAPLLKQHAKSHDRKDRDQFTCDICNMACSTAGVLKCHKMTHAQPAVECPTCGKFLKSKPILKKHMAHKHSSERPFACNKCAATFKTSDAFWKHRTMVHSEGTPFQCTKCPMAFKAESYLRGHIKRSHEALHICRVCGQEFPGRVRLWRHEMEVHDLDRSKTKFQCEHCSKVFGNRTLLEHHVVIHKDEAHFVCDTCGKSFKTKASLTQHLITHQSYEEFKHKCDVCGKRFGLAHHVRQHKRSAHKELVQDTTDNS